MISPNSILYSEDLVRMRGILNFGSKSKRIPTSPHLYPVCGTNLRKLYARRIILHYLETMIKWKTNCRVFENSSLPVLKFQYFIILSYHFPIPFLLLFVNTYIFLLMHILLLTTIKTIISSTNCSYLKFLSRKKEQRWSFFLPILWKVYSKVDKQPGNSRNRQ